MLLSFLTAVGAFIVGLTARSMGQRIAHPWIVTLVLLLPALYYGSSIWSSPPPGRCWSSCFGPSPWPGAA